MHNNNSNINSTQEYFHLYDSMFTSQIKGYSRMEFPKGRKETLDSGDSYLTQIREFIEETGGYYHPDKFRNNKHHEIVEKVKGFNNVTYINHYSIHIDNQNFLRKYDDEDNLAEFILTYMNYKSPNDKNAIKYKNKFKYILSYDSMKHPIFVYFKDLTCLSKNIKEELKRVIGEFIKKNNE